MAISTQQDVSVATGVWVLSECRDDGHPGQQISIPTVVSEIGRSSATPITIASNSVSKRHAEIGMELGRPVVRDLGSTNGTFVNGRAAEGAPLADGDVVQFAGSVFRVVRPATVEFGATAEGSAAPFAAALLQFDELMSGNGVIPNFQPIVHMSDAKIVGYELLARSGLEELRNPAAMFTTAAKLGQECALSELMRREGVRDALKMKNCGNLFVNTHPREMIQDRFLDSLIELRVLAPQMEITIEVHEAAVSSREEMKRFREILNGHGMHLAYDDFGAGQARLDELSEVPPECLKFDMKLIRDIDSAPASRQALVASLVRMTLDLGTTPLAECIETEAEAETCREMGFVLAQGYYYGRPAPLADIREIE